jgi:translation initiation factor 2B subunit (eIF-2B alpha/beta/delta family)
MKQVSINVTLKKGGAEGMVLRATFKENLPWKVIKKDYKVVSGKNVQRFIEVLIRNGFETDRKQEVTNNLHNYIVKLQTKNQKAKKQMTEQEAYRNWENILTQTLNKMIAEGY